MNQNTKKLRLALLTTLLLSLLLAILTGCGGSEKKGPSKKEIIKALEDTDCHVFCIDGEDVELELDSLEIVLQDTEDGWSEILAEAIFENGIYKAETEMLIGFTHYDKGGWVLEAGDFTYCNLSVEKSPFDKNTILASIEDSFSECSVSSIASEKSENGSFTQTFVFSGTIDHDYLSTTLSGHCTYVFEDNTWKKECVIDTAEYDWSRLIGSWTYRNESAKEGASSYRAILHVDITDVKQINDSQLEITYSGDSSVFDNILDHWWVYGEEVPSQTCVLNIITTADTLFGAEVRLPARASNITLPWAYNTPVKIYIDRASGLDLPDDFHDKDVYHFAKKVSTEDLQAAIDRMNEMNGAK